MDRMAAAANRGFYYDVPMEEYSRGKRVSGTYGGRIPKEKGDSAETIKMCLSCSRPDCNNCVGNRSMKKYEAKLRKYKFHGKTKPLILAVAVDTFELMGKYDTFKEAADKNGFKQSRIYSGFRTKNPAYDCFWFRVTYQEYTELKQIIENIKIRKASENEYIDYIGRLIKDG